MLETAFDMDFKPGAKAGQRNTLRIDTPGVYLIRVETRETQSDHEHFAAIDLVVEKGSEEGHSTIHSPSPPSARPCRSNCLTSRWARSFSRTNQTTGRSRRAKTATAIINNRTDTRGTDSSARLPSERLRRDGLRRGSHKDNAWDFTQEGRRT